MNMGACTSKQCSQASEGEASKLYLFNGHETAQHYVHKQSDWWLVGNKGPSKTVGCRGRGLLSVLPLSGRGKGAEAHLSAGREASEPRFFPKVT